MNIEELWGQALDKTVSYTWTKLDAEEIKAVRDEFANLILAECFLIIRMHMPRNDHNSPENIQSKKIIDKIQEHFSIQQNHPDPREAELFLIRAGIIKPNRRTLEGSERDAILQVLNGLEPDYTSNNQRFFTDHYTHNGLKYEVSYIEGEVEVEEIK